jgi:voltage-gated potassium channel
MTPFVKFFIAISSVLLLVVGGTLGYTLIEGWSLSDSLYMTFITFTTVGFGEVHTLSQAGRSFTIIILIGSVAVVGYSVTTLITYIFEGVFIDLMRERRMTKNIRKIKEHFIICGCGNTGREAAVEFKRSNVKFLAIDSEPERSELQRDESILFIKGDAVDDEVLIEANIEEARGLIASLPDDEANLFVVLSARQLNPNLFIVAQATEERTIQKLMKAGADRVISPKQIAGRRLASIALRPSVVNFLDIVVEGVGGVDIPMRLEEVRLFKESPIVGHSLRDAGIGKCTGALILAIHGPGGRTRVNPTSTTSIASVEIKEDDILIALGSDEQIEKLQTFVEKGSKDAVKER